MDIMAILMPNTRNYFNINLMVPRESKLTGMQVRYLLFHLTKLFGITDSEEYNAYLDNVPKCQGLSIDDLYAKLMDILPYWEKNIKIQLFKEDLEVIKNE